MVLTLVLTVVSLVTAPLTGVEEPEVSSAWLIGWYAITYTLHAAVISILLAVSVWRRMKLAVAIFLIYFGVTVFLTQIEAVLFLEMLTDHMTVGDVYRLSLQGLFVALIFAVAAAWLAQKKEAQVK